MRSSRLLLALAFLFSIYDLAGQDLEVRATGSGFAISKTGDVVTNQHVVSDCSAVAVKIDGSIERALVIGTDSQKDLALLRIKRQFPSPLSLRSDQRLRLGESITVLGFPLQGLLASSLSLTTGSLSALAGLGDDAGMFQFTAPVQPGNSGGPVLDEDGQVIGVVQSKLSTAAAAFLGDIPQNVNFAIRGSVVRSFLDSRGVEYENRSSIQPLSPTAIGETAGKSVVLVQCLGVPTPISRTSKAPADAVKPEISGILFVAQRTARHRSWSSGKMFDNSNVEFNTIADDILLLLKQKKLRLANDNSVSYLADRYASHREAYSTYELTEAARKAEASYVIVLTFDRPASGKVKLQAHCLTADGAILWDEETQDRSWIKADGSGTKAPATMETFRAQIEKHIDQMPFPKHEPSRQ